MKKLAIIGIVFAGLLLPLATAQAKPAGMTKADQQPQQALIREKLEEIGAWAVPSTSGQKPPVRYSRQALIRQKLEEIGAWAVPSTSGQKPPVRYSRQALIRQKLEEVGAWAVPSTSTPPTVVASSSDGFDWNYLGIGAGFAAALLLGAVGVVTARRHHHRPLAH
jgi:hypothetical protein